jgi:acyl-CoA reductase-like NAD-dependent aldehyde dehydrogenase
LTFTSSTEVSELLMQQCDAEAIKMANDTEFGLAAYFSSRDMAASGASPRGSNMASSASTRA